MSNRKNGKKTSSEVIYSCIDCGGTLKDFKKRLITKNPDDQDFCDNTERLFHDLNGNRRFFCPDCDLGYSEDDIIINKCKSISKKDELNEKYIMLITGLLVNAERDLAYQIKHYPHDNKTYRYFGKVDAYKNALSLFKRHIYHTNHKKRVKNNG